MSSYDEYLKEKGLTKNHKCPNCGSKNYAPDEIFLDNPEKSDAKGVSIKFICEDCGCIFTPTELTK